MPTLFYDESRRSSPVGEGKPSNAFNISASLGRRLFSSFTPAQKAIVCENSQAPSSVDRILDIT